MKSHFDSSLISKCQKLIFKRSGKKISKVKAELYLEKFARYFMLAVDVLDQEEKYKKQKNKSSCKK